MTKTYRNTYGNQGLNRFYLFQNCEPHDLTVAEGKISLDVFMTPELCMVQDAIIEQSKKIVNVPSDFGYLDDVNTGNVILRNYFRNAFDGLRPNRKIIDLIQNNKSCLISGPGNYNHENEWVVSFGNFCEENVHNLVNETLKNNYNVVVLDVDNKRKHELSPASDGIVIFPKGAVKQKTILSDMGSMVILPDV